MKLAICFSGLMRTFWDEKVYNNTFDLIEELRKEFDYVKIVGLTEPDNSYPPYGPSMTDVSFHREEDEFYMDKQAFDKLGFNNFVIDDNTELNKYLDNMPVNPDYIEHWDSRSHAIGQCWKHKKCTELLPDMDVYVRLRWDVAPAAYENIIANIKEFYTLYSSSTEPFVFFYGLCFDPNKERMFFKDYAPIISNNKAQTIFNNQLKDTFQECIMNDPYHARDTKFWFDAYGPKCNIFAPSINNHDDYSITRPTWWENKWKK